MLGSYEGRALTHDCMIVMITEDSARAISVHRGQHNLHAVSLQGQLPSSYLFHFSLTPLLSVVTVTKITIAKYLM